MGRTSELWPFWNDHGSDNPIMKCRYIWQFHIVPFYHTIDFFNNKKFIFFILFFQIFNNRIMRGDGARKPADQMTKPNKCYHLIIRTTNCWWLISDALFLLNTCRLQNYVHICKPHLVCVYSSIQWGWFGNIQKTHPLIKWIKRIVLTDFNANSLD